MTTQIKEYTVTEAALADLRQRFQGITFDVSTTKGDKEARSARQELVSLRTGLESKRKEIKAPALEYCRLIDAEAARIKDEIETLEKPIDQIIKAEEQRKAAEKAEKERIERERISAIHTRIAEIQAAVSRCRGASSDQIKLEIDRMRGLHISINDFAEFTGHAENACKEVIDQLLNEHQSATAIEEERARMKAEREELARQQAEQRRIEAEAAAERKRLDDIARAQREADEKAARDRVAAELAEQQRVAAEEARKQQEALALAATQLREQQERFAAEQEAARIAALPPEPEELPFALSESPDESTRPTNEQILMLVADTYSVNESVAYEWLISFSADERRAAA